MKAVRQQTLRDLDQSFLVNVWMQVEAPARFPFQVGQEFGVALPGLLRKMEMEPENLQPAIDSNAVEIGNAAKGRAHLSNSLALRHTRSLLHRLARAGNGDGELPACLLLKMLL